MLLSRSTGRKVLVTAAAAVTFRLAVRSHHPRFRNATRELELRDSDSPPVARGTARFQVTGLLQRHDDCFRRERSDRDRRLDPELLPVGSVIQIDKLGDRYNGIYTIMDTGPAVQGRELDIYMWNCNEALALGRRAAAVTVVRLGWNPEASTPRLIDRLFRQSEAHLPTQPLEPQPFRSRAV